MYLSNRYGRYEKHEGRRGHRHPDQQQQRPAHLRADLPADQGPDHGREPDRRRGAALHAGPGQGAASQRVYEDLTRDGFIETVSGKGSFVAAQNKEFIREERLRVAEDLLRQAADIGRSNGIPLERLAGILALFYEGGDR